MSSGTESAAGPPPLVSVVMTAFNAEETIGPAILSVLAQELQDFELVIVDDGSTDTTADVVRSIVDGRIRLVSPGRLGRSAAVNHGVDLAEGDFIAIADADDVALPNRLRDQYQYMVAHPEVDVLGGQMTAIWGTRSWQLNYPLTHVLIVGELSAGRMPVAHPAVMMRKAWFLQVGGMNPEYSRVEDFDLYYRSRAVTRFAALPEPLINYRFKTLSFDRWRQDNALFLRAQGKKSTLPHEGLVYLKYRVAIATQKRGWNLTPRGRGVSSLPIDP